MVPSLLRFAGWTLDDIDQPDARESPRDFPLPEQESRSRMLGMIEAPVGQLRWQGAALLPAAAREALTGAGAPFELVTEPVLGHRHVVFARRPRSLREMLDAQAAATPDLAFLISPERQWTYREAIEAIDATAVLLGERYGVTAGDRVAIVAANHAEYAILMWAVVTLGAIVTSLNGWWSTPELEYGIGLTSPLLIAGDERRLARLADGSVPAGVPVRLTGELQREAREFTGKTPAPAGVTEDSAAVILFTSGTTGRPRGATLSHRNIINFAMVNRLAAAMAAAVAPGPAPGPARGCTIVASPMFHVSGMIAVLLTGAAFPTTLVFPPPGPWDPRTWLELTARHKVTTWSGVPTQWWRLLRHPDIGSYDVSSVLAVGSGGAVFPPELVRAMHAVGLPRLLGRPGRHPGRPGREPVVPDWRSRADHRRHAVPGKPAPGHDHQGRREHLPHRNREPAHRAPRSQRGRGDRCRPRRTRPGTQGVRRPPARFRPHRGASPGMVRPGAGSLQGPRFRGVPGIPPLHRDGQAAEAAARARGAGARRCWVRPTGGSTRRSAGSRCRRCG